MKKLNISLLAIITLSILVIISSYKYSKLNKDYKNLYLKQIKNTQYDNTLLTNLKRMRHFEISVNNKKIKEGYYFKNKFEQNVSLDTVIKRKKLMFYFNTKACSSCLEKELKEIENSKKIKDKIIILTDYTSLADFHKRARTIPNNLILLNLSKPLKFMQKNNLPIFFVLDKNMNITKSFIPNDDTYHDTKKYLDIISTYL